MLAGDSGRRDRVRISVRKIQTVTVHLQCEVCLEFNKELQLSRKHLEPSLSKLEAMPACFRTLRVEEMHSLIQ